MALKMILLELPPASGNGFLWKLSNRERLFPYFYSGHKWPL